MHISFIEEGNSFKFSNYQTEAKISVTSLQIYVALQYHKGG